MSLRNTYNKYDKQSGDLNSGAKLNSRSSSGTVILFAAFFISCAVMFYVASPIRKEAKIIEFANEAKAKDLELGRSLFLKIIKINSKNKKINSEGVEKIGGLIPNRNNYEDYLAHIVDLAVDKNIGINNFSISKDEEDKNGKNKNKGEEKDGGAFSKTSIKISASGGFLNFVSFMREIENGIPFVCERSISISVSDQDDSGSEENSGEESGADIIDTDPILDYEISIEFYHY